LIKLKLPNTTCGGFLGVCAIYKPFSHFGFICPQAESRPAHLRVTQTVETVEKVPFQKLFLKSGRETLKSIWFGAFRTTFWRFLSLWWEVFREVFQTKGFSTVSLGGKTERNEITEPRNYHGEHLSDTKMV